MAELTLVQDGQPRADIIIAEQPPRMVKLAASELQTYVEKMSGAKLPVVTVPAAGASAHVLVGRSAHTDRLKIADDDLKYGAFRMVSGQGWLALVGRDRDFVPPQPCRKAMSPDDRARTLREWDALTGESRWLFPHDLLHKQYSRKLDLWDYDERGSHRASFTLTNTISTARPAFRTSFPIVLPRTCTALRASRRESASRWPGRWALSSTRPV